MKEYIVLFVVMFLITIYLILIDRFYVGPVFASKEGMKRRIYVYTRNNYKYAYVHIDGHRVEARGYYTDPVKTLEHKLNELGWTIEVESAI